MHRTHILKAFNHEEGEKVPIDFGGHRSSGISAIAYANLREALNISADPIRVYDFIQQLAVIDNSILDLFHSDTIELGRGFSLSESDWKNWTLPTGIPCTIPAWTNIEEADNGWIHRSQNNGNILARMPQGALYLEQTYFPMKDGLGSQSVKDAAGEVMWFTIPAPPGPCPENITRKEYLRSGAAALRSKSDRAIIGLFGGNLFELGQFLLKNDNFFILLASEPLKAHLLLDEIVEMHLEALEKYLDSVGDYIDIILFGDDLGMQTGPQISPKMYREFFKKRHERLWRRAKELAPVKVLLHSCGGIRELLPDLIEAGLDAVNPVQTTCRGMGADSLKKDFGKDIVLWGGGCDTREILPHANPQEIKTHVKKNLDILVRDGGFVFQQVHNIMADVPPENIIAMFEAVNEYK